MGTESNKAEWDRGHMGLRGWVDLVLGRALVGIMALMVLNVLWQVFSRYVTGDPSHFTDELSRYLMIWVGVLGAAYVSGRNMHVAIDLLPMRAGERARRLMGHLVTSLVVLFALSALVVGGGRLVYISYVLGQRSAALGVPLALVYTVVPLAGILIVYYKIDDLLKKK